MNIPAIPTRTRVDWLLGHGHPVNSVGLPQGRITLVTHDAEGEAACLAWLTQVGQPVLVAHVGDLYKVIRTSSAPVLYMPAPTKGAAFHGICFSSFVPKLCKWLRLSSCSPPFRQHGPGFVFYGPQASTPPILKYFASVSLAFLGREVVLQKTALSARQNTSLAADVMELPPNDLSLWPSDNASE